MAGGWVGAPPPPPWGCCAVDSEKVETCESGMQSGSCWLVEKLTSWPMGVGLFWVRLGSNLVHRATERDHSLDFSGFMIRDFDYVLIVNCAIG